MANPAVRNLIRENKAHQLQTVMQTGASQGMVTMEKALSIFVERGIIAKEEMNRRLITAV